MQVPATPPDVKHGYPVLWKVHDVSAECGWGVDPQKSSVMSAVLPVHVRVKVFAKGILKKCKLHCDMCTFSKVCYPYIYE